MSVYLKEALRTVKKHHPTASPFQMLKIVAEHCDDLRPEALRFLAVAAI